MLFLILKILAVSVCGILAQADTIHTLQTVKYHLPALRVQLRKRYKGFIRAEYMIATVAALVNWYLPILLAMGIQKETTRENLCNWLVLVSFIAAGIVVFIGKRKVPQSRPFIFTRRALRLIVLMTVINTVGAVVLHTVGLSPYIMYAGSVYTVSLAELIMDPIEESLNIRYYKNAVKKLRSMKNLVRIGITGSRGKTTTKLALKEMLSHKYSVLATPPSFAGEMGIARTITDKLTNKHRIFIAELGIIQKGDIKAMAKMVSPQIGILTCIGKDHIDTMGSIEEIANEKMHLIEGLSEKGRAFFGSDNGFGDRKYALCKKNKFRAAIGTEVESDMHAENIRMDVTGSAFDLVSKDGEKIEIKTRLLGESNILDIVLAACVSRQLGVSMEDIADGASKVKPLQGRLQLIPGTVNVIDNSENGSEEGAAQALSILAAMPGKKFLVSAGITEPEGDRSDRNFAYGTMIKGCADYVILLDPQNTKSVMEGMTSVGFDESKVRMVREDRDAVDLIRQKVRKGDTILYEGIYPEEG